MPGSPREFRGCPIPTSYKTHNVASELKDPNSILVFYKNLLMLRHHQPALLDGDYVPLNEDDPNVLSYLRRYKDEAVLVVLNMSGAAQTVHFDLSKHGLPATDAKTLLTTMPNLGATATLSEMSLAPFSVYIGSLSNRSAEALAH